MGWVVEGEGSAVVLTSLELVITAVDGPVEVVEVVGLVENRTVSEIDLVFPYLVNEALDDFDVPRSVDLGCIALGSVSFPFPFPLSRVDFGSWSSGGSPGGDPGWWRNWMSTRFGIPVTHKRAETSSSSF